MRAPAHQLQAAAVGPAEVADEPVEDFRAAALKAAARLPAVRAVWPRRRKRRALTAEVARSSRIEETKRPDRVPKSRVELTPDFQSSQGQTRNSSRSSRTWSAGPITMPSVAPWFSPQAARARGRKGGRPPEPRRQEEAARRGARTAPPTNSVRDICRTLGVSKATLYRYLTEQRRR